MWAWAGTTLALALTLINEFRAPLGSIFFWRRERYYVHEVLPSSSGVRGLLIFSSVQFIKCRPAIEWDVCCLCYQKQNKLLLLLVLAAR